MFLKVVQFKLNHEIIVKTHFTSNDQFASRGQDMKKKKQITMKNANNISQYTYQ